MSFLGFEGDTMANLNLATLVLATIALIGVWKAWKAGTLPGYWVLFVGIIVAGSFVHFIGDLEPFQFLPETEHMIIHITFMTGFAVPAWQTLRKRL